MGFLLTLYLIWRGNRWPGPGSFFLCTVLWSVYITVEITVYIGVYITVYIAVHSAYITMYIALACDASSKSDLI